MRYAEVAVAGRLHRASGSFTYSVPPALDLAPGQIVWVSFGQRQTQGVVLSLSDEDPGIPTKDILSVQEAVPALRHYQIELARWMASYYYCSLAAAVNQLIPAELRQTAVPVYTLGPQPLEDQGSDLRAAILAALADGPKPLTALAELGRPAELRKELRQLTRERAITEQWVAEGPKARSKTERFVRLEIPLAELPVALGSLARAPRQAALLKQVAEAGAEVPAAELSSQGGSVASALSALAARGYVSLLEREVRRSPLRRLEIARQPLPTLTERQAAALTRITAALRENKSETFLLHGVTGSGKGEIYLHVLAEALRRRKQAIVLVPEIALTPQTVRRFASRFPGRVAVLHSALSAGEHYDEWRRIRDGEADIVIGSRSALFAPLPRPGLIIVDEEHEWSYKQADQEPRFHAREAAIALARIVGGIVVLGSATPDVGTYYAARELKAYRLLELPERVRGGAPAGRQATTAGPPVAPPTIPMPAVQVVDMKEEQKAGNRTIFSRALRQALAATLAAGNQAILFLNRRGAATLVMCRDCGFVARCRRCEVPFVYHADRTQLVCHHCNRRAAVPSYCPACWSRKIGYFGLGTQRVEAEVKAAFPKARVVRWDRDTTRTRASHDQLLERFIRGEADVLVGTQMIAKGLDLPRVALVGIVAADLALQLPDFRSSERTFQLLTQVAGRAGRGSRPGTVVIQTYNPEHHCIKAASQHDYGAFYDYEVSFRSTYRYPPFSRLARLVYSHSHEARCRAAAEALALELQAEINRRGLPGLEVIGPAPAFRQRLRGRFRWHIIIRGVDPGVLFESMVLPRGWVLDVDPVSLL